MSEPALSPPRHPRRRSPAATERIRTRLNIMLDETCANEQVIAVGRLALCIAAAAFTVGVSVGRRGGATNADSALLGCCAAGAIYSLAMLAAIRTGRYQSRYGYLSVTVDISLVSGWLWGQVAVGQADLAVENHLSTPLYLLAIAISGLRYNQRLTLYGMSLAMVEYALVLAVAQPALELVMDVEMQAARLLLIACSGAVAMFGVRRSRELRTAAILDALTGLYNRGFLEERLHIEFERAERYQRELAVAMFDVDHFKAYNDTHGHTAGDLALQEIASLLRDGLRRTDTVARYGGEEFVALLPETGKPQAVALLERLRTQVAEHRFSGLEAADGRLTISVGVATYPSDATALEALRQHADEALYRAKADGRNCVRG